MQRKNDNFLEKFVKKNYNNQLEEVLEKKYFDENAKNFLLSILYRVETGYKDYEKVKQQVEPKEEYIEYIINCIQKNCEDIKIVKQNTEESKVLGNKTFLVEKEKKRIICYPVERKLLYCLSKISKEDIIVKGEYLLLNEALSSLLNTGNNIDMVEPMRDFNGYSWTIVVNEIESLAHNLIFQNLRILVGYSILNRWIRKNEFMINYLESLENKLEEKYGIENAEKIVEILKKISILLAFKYEPRIKEKIKKEKNQVEESLEKIENNQVFITQITQKKKKLTQEIKNMDEMINNKELLQKEYEKRNELLSLKEKIFSIRILSQMISKEREEKIGKIEQLNELLNPQNFIEYKRLLEQKEEYLKLIEERDIENTIYEQLMNLQKVFLNCYEKKIEKVQSKQDFMKVFYEFRYYNLLPCKEDTIIRNEKYLQEELEQVEKKLLKKAHELKIIDSFSKDKDIDYKILRNIFSLRAINLEEIYLKLIKEKEQYFVQLFDENIFEEKIEVKDIEILNKKDLEIKFNKKIKIFN